MISIAYTIGLLTTSCRIVMYSMA